MAGAAGSTKDTKHILIVVFSVTSDPLASDAVVIACTHRSVWLALLRSFDGALDQVYRAGENFKGNNRRARCKTSGLPLATDLYPCSLLAANALELSFSTVVETAMSLVADKRLAGAEEGPRPEAVSH